MRFKLIRLKIYAVIFSIFTFPNVRSQEQTQKTSEDNIHTEFLCGHVSNKSVSVSTKPNAITSKLLNSNIGKQTVLGDLDFLIIRTNFVGGTVEQEFTEGDADIFMDALDSYVRKLSYNKTNVKTYEVTEVFQSNLTAADIEKDLNKISDEMKRLAKNAGYKVDNRLVYLVMDAPSLNIGAGAFGTGNGKNGTTWWPSNLGVQVHGAGWSHETFHMFGIGHLGLIETTGQNSYPGSRNAGGLDPYHFMGTEGGLTRWDASNPREALTGQLPIPNKVRLGWLSEDNLIVTPGTNNQKIRFNITDGTDSNLGNKKVGVVINGHRKTFSLGYYKNLENSSDRLDQRGGVLVHEWDQGFFARTFLLDAHPNSVDGSPDPRRQSDAWKSVFEFTDAAIRVGETMSVGDLFKIKVESEGGSGNNRWVEVSIITESVNNDCDWSKKPGQGTDIGAGANKVFTVGTNKLIYRWDSGRWIEMPGVKAKRIDVAFGSPYIIAENNDIYRSLRNDRWEKIPGEALDVGGNSKALAVIWANNRIYKYKGNGKWDTLLDIKGKRIDIDEKGNPWIIGMDNQIYQFLGNKWDKKGNFEASDISISDNGNAIWAIQRNTRIPFIYKGSGKWEKFTGFLANISVQDNGDLWGTNRRNNIFENKCYDQNTTRQTTLDQKANMVMYPNPTFGKLFIEVSDTKNSMITTTVVDMNGRVLQKNNFTDKVYNKNAGRLELNLSGFEKGIYIVKVSIDAKQSISKQVIIQ